MQALSPETLRDIFDRSCNEYAKRVCMGYTDEVALTYGQFKTAVLNVQHMLNERGIAKGDRVAILSQNMPNWGIAFFAITAMGAVAVPILPDFAPGEIHNILDHSGSKGIFVSQRLQTKIDASKIPDSFFGISLDDLSLLPDISGITVNQGLVTEFPAEARIELAGDDIASIIYTSGTTGRSKGVMLTHTNIVFNAVKVLTIQPVVSSDVFLSVLPLSHAYENTLGLIVPVMQGASVYYLKKPPTASVLIPALQEIRPTTMLTVPMIMEKIYKSQVLAKFTGNALMRVLYAFPPVRKILHRLAGKKLMHVFGDRLRFFGIGGAKLDVVVERFLKEARFPYAIGYGLTETAPLLAGSNPGQTVLKAVGPVMEGVELKIASPDPHTGMGEILAKGKNVMKGYYQEPELTAEAFTVDGWFKTGDLGSFDSKGNLQIRGRLKNMILTATGENIYPEDIESLINNFHYVIESIVIEKKGKLVALVHFDAEALHKQFEHLKEDARNFIMEKINTLQEELMIYVNERVNKYSRLQAVVVMQTPFEKTPTLKIKRYLYH